jgi:hypothetical protein
VPSSVPRRPARSPSGRACTLQVLVTTRRDVLLLSSTIKCPWSPNPRRWRNPWASATPHLVDLALGEPSVSRAQPWTTEGPIPANFDLRYTCTYADEPHCELCGQAMLVTEQERRALWGICTSCWPLPKKGGRR